MVNGDDLDAMPSGARGIYFASTDRYTWKEFADGIAEAMVKVGGIKTKEVKKVGLEEAAAEWTGGHQLLCELNFGSKYVSPPLFSLLFFPFLPLSHHLTIKQLTPLPPPPFRKF